MASQRRAPTKRPPRPAAKKQPPPLDAADGTDAAQAAATAKDSAAAKGAAKGKAPAPVKPVKAGPSKTATTKVAPPRVTKTAAPGTATAATTAGGKEGASGPKPKTSPTGPSGPNYRPPTGATRSAARRPPPAPKRKKRRMTRKTIGTIVALALVGTLLIFFSVAVNSSSSDKTNTINTALTPEGVPVPKGQPLAAVDAARYPQTIDGITCNTSEQLVYHIHAHLAIFVDGQAKQVPYGIGIGPPLQSTDTNGTFVQSGSCFYWLHTHASDGIMHIESPTQTTYTLGQFFDVWGQPLKAGQVGPALGKLTAYVNGKAFTGDPRTIPLTAHAQIQLDVGSPSPAPIAVTFPGGL